MSIKSVMPSSHLILCHPLLLLPPVAPSIRVFFKESTLFMKWPKYWSFSFSVIPSKEHPGLISFRMDLLDLLAVQGTLKSLLQHHSSKASIWCSAFLTAQLSHPYMTTGKATALTRRTFVGKVMSLLLNMLSRLVITFLPKSKCLFNFMAEITICSDFGQYISSELPNIQVGFRKGRGSGDQTAHIHGIIEKVREFQKNIYFYFIDYAKAFVWIKTYCGFILIFGKTNTIM